MQTHRGVVVATNGVVAASQPLAVSAGLNILMEGGTFIDASIAASAVLAVVEPYASHLGGDAFTIVYDASERSTTAYNGSGAAPLLASPDLFTNAIPTRGLRAATVPGLVSTWFALHERHGLMPIAKLLQPAIRYASDGFPAGYRYAAVMKRQFAANEPWFGKVMQTVAGSDVPPKAGTSIRQPELAWTLERIAKGGRQSFYDGEITERMIAFSEQHEGLFTRDDFRNHVTQVSEPARVVYRGYTVHGQPPVSQGHILLQELSMLENFDVSAMEANRADAVHVMVEAMKLAFKDKTAYLGDPGFVNVPVNGLLDKEYGRQRALLINMARANPTPVPGNPARDTTYFCVADAHGNAVSFIQSVFHGFGCGAVADGTGILFNNRMTGFSLERDSPNFLAPGKRPVHTLNAYLITKGDRLAWVGGTPGGNVQVQSNLQVISNVIDRELNPQEAIESPRWQQDGGPLQIENRVGQSVLDDLVSRGHEAQQIGPWAHGSSYQLIAVDPISGCYHAGSDPRCDGHAAGY